MPELVGATLPSSNEASYSQIIDTVLQCNFTGKPRVNVTWKYPSEINGCDTSVHYSSTGLTWTQGSLKITSVPKSCSTYNVTCVGGHQFGNTESSTVVNVSSKSFFTKIFVEISFCQCYCRLIA